MRGLLTEMRDLPNCVDPAEWAKFLAEEEGNGAAEPGAASRSDWLDIGPLPALVISRPARFEASMSLPTGCLHVRNAQNP